jgi:hypothetical protein
MRSTYSAVVIAALAIVMAAASATDAFAFNKRVRRACGLDYQDFCSQHDPNGSAVRRCFEANRKSLSKGCVRALVDSGLVPSKYRK